MKKIKAILIGTTLLAVISAGCSVTTEDATEPTEAPVVAEAPVEAPAPVTAPPVTAAPVTAPPAPPVVPATPDVDINACADVDVNETSTLIPDNWDEWCLGVLAGETLYYSMSAGEAQALCEAFWTTTDEDILTIFTSPEGGGNSRDSAIGIIDSLWLSCSGALV